MVPKKVIDYATFDFSIKDGETFAVTSIEIGDIVKGFGLKEGDYTRNKYDVKWTIYEEIYQLIKTAGNTITLKVVTSTG